MNVCVAHIEGGEITGTIDESIRHAITKLSHLHFVCTEEARQRVVSMGEKEAQVIHTGCPAMDIIINLDLSTGNQIQSFWDSQAKWEMKGVTEGGFIIVSHHPVTTDIEQSLKEFDIITDAILKLEIQPFFSFQMWMPVAKTWCAW